VPPVYHIRGTETGFAVRCLHGGDALACDVAGGGYNGSLWHAANGTMRGRKLRIRFDSDLGTGKVGKHL
jgi:hypothetical protein